MAQAFLIGGNGASLPSGGSAGFALTKTSSNDYAVGWTRILPYYASSYAGKVLRVNASGSSTEWGSGLPDYDSTKVGRALVIKYNSSTSAYEPSWEFATPAATSSNIGQVLSVKSVSGTPTATWVSPSSEIYTYASNQVYVRSSVTGTNYPIVGASSEGNGYKTLYSNANVYIDGTNGVLMGAAWNDYAECREGNNTKPGMCMIEAGDDRLILSNEYAHGSAYIVSDTYGMAIGQTDKATIPVALTGRVLAYTEEGRDIYSQNIGAPVCSGEHGMIHLMDELIAREKPWAIIGTVASVPAYEKWNGVSVDGRVWIKVK